MAVGIAGYGVYIPRYRIRAEEYVKAHGRFAAAGVLEKAVLAHDEDATTMAVEASINALKSSGVEAAQLTAIFTATTTPTYEEKSLSSTLATALGARDVFGADLGLSSKAGSAALISAANLVSARGGFALVVASDAPKASTGDDLDHGFGAGAAAYVLGAGDVAVEIEDYYSVCYESWGGRMRLYGEKYPYKLGITAMEREEVTKPLSLAARGLMEKMGTSPQDFSYLATYQENGRMPFAVARAVGMSDEQAKPGLVADRLGDTGASSSLLSLAAVLEKAKSGERILLLSYGSGATADAVSLRVLDGVESIKGKAPSLNDYIGSREYINFITYLRWRRFFLTPSRR